MPLHPIARPASAFSLTVVLVLAGCSAAPTVDDTAADMPDASQTVFEHIHGIGLNPADDSVYVATHRGLFRLDDSVPQRVGETRSDLMGFLVTGPDSFYASGHPAPGEAAPANLGLLSSTDAGAAWENVSLRGHSDFHDLTGVDDRLYGLDSSDGRLKRSDDAGVTWTSGPTVAARDIDVDPNDPDRLVVTAEAGLLVSTDGGEAFAPHEVQPPERLVLVAHVRGRSDQLTASLAGLDAVGRLWVFDGAGWAVTGVPRGAPEAFVAIGEESYLAAFDGTVFRTGDAGRSWSQA
ncbi:F510_1955 family glycosylhydrolase [Sanguibacter sp. 25GB23B1]|uniref:F510_1955 family glycosylhydrolase n=1 Tax=unclassified Sanguibacter TaxID=2645534 RepID=UPI0032AEDF50